MADLELSSLRLRWPRDLFVSEAEELLQDPFTARGLWLLARAFVGDDALDAALEGGDQAVLRLLVRDIDSIRDEYERRPLFSERHGRSRQQPAPGLGWAKEEVAKLAIRYYRTGALGRELRPSCPDDRTNDGDPSAALYRLTGLEGLWPLGRSLREHDDDAFFDVLEALDGLVVMPRRRDRHGYASCNWHYGDFSRQLGQRVYRFEVNQILTFADVPYRLAESGEDAGTIVTTGGDDLAPLLEWGAAQQGIEAGEVCHSVSLFRSRGATPEEKRSAVVSLARVLEQHRRLLKTELRRDEADLFNIANNFDIRHSRDGQQGDYDPVFLDWVFWWYLATIELLNRLLERQGSAD